VKIAYAGYVAAYTTDGVNDKIRAQIAAWTDMGHEVELYCLSPPPTPGDDAPRVHGSIFTFTTIPERFKATRGIEARVELVERGKLPRFAYKAARVIDET